VLSPGERVQHGTPTDRHHERSREGDQMSSPRIAPQAPAGPIVPATLCSNSGEGPSTFLNIGKTFVRFPNDNRQAAGYWFVAVDLTTQLNVVANVINLGGGVPPEIKKLQGDPRYFIFVLGNQLRGQNVPVGELYAFLKSIGSGKHLAQLEQIATSCGTGTLMRFTYLLAATATEGDLPGFEAWSDSLHVYVTMQFVPIKHDDKIVYAPVQQF
jgi:hypothetical protein